MQIYIENDKISIPLISTEIMLTGIDGIGINTDINTVDNYDTGAYTQGIHIPCRIVTLTFDIYPTGEKYKNIADKIYSLCQHGQAVKIRIQDDTQDVYCNGYCSSCTPAQHSIPAYFAIQIKCADPYFYDYNSNIITMLGLSQDFEIIENEWELNAVEFGNFCDNNVTEINNNGACECGFICVINIIDTVNNITLQNLTTNEKMQINTAFISGDKIIINTQTGQRNIKLIRGEAEYNIIGALSDDSTFFQLQQGKNIIYVNDENNSNSTQYNVSIDFNGCKQGVSL